MDKREPSSLFSHPFVYIEDHTNRCLELANFFLEERLPVVSRDFKAALLLAVALHDFGKTTSYFQDYMKAVMEGRPFKHPYFGRRKLTEHALLGSLYAFYISKKILKDELLPFFLFVACRRHHTNLKSFQSEAKELDKEDEEFLKEQINSIDEEKANIFLSNLALPEDIKPLLIFSKEDFLKHLPDVASDIKSYTRHFRKTLRGDCRTSFGDYLTFQYLFSLVLDADKTEAGAKPYIPERFKIPPSVVETFKSKNLKPSREIDHLRERAYKEVLSKEINLNNKLYSLTLPTGMGKTLTGFAFALKLRDRIFKEVGYTPRIVYSLPFLSIIDQNAEVLKEVLSTLGGVKTSLLLKHHHLSDRGYDEYEYSVSRVLTEGWNSEVVITTFVQLFHTLFAYRNSDIRRFNKLAGSILIVDEVQALSHRYWHLLRNTLEEIAHKLSTYVILMTATQPYLLPKAKELASPNYFDQLDRITVKIDTQSQTLEEFAESLSLAPNKTYLFITNTVGSSKRLYELLKEKLDEPICYLSTAVTPFERKERITHIKENRYKIVVSTQLVEAGVDIDFDVVFRDLAPMDSLIQSAGRCNRNNEKGKGEFVIVKLKNEEKRPFWSFIYDPILVQETEKLLSGKAEISEPQFTHLCEEYFESLWENKISSEESKKIEKAVRCLRFDGEGEEAVSRFKLIEEEMYKQDVFVEINQQAKDAWQKAKEILRNLKSKKIDLFTAKEEFEKLKPEFYNYVISVDVRKNTPVRDDELGIFYVPMESLEMFYDKETGFRSESDGWWEV